ncbi:MAG: hypothetical protein GF317_18980 [Candidatus Lokiarchaeota archaeon]|nr:hypothetical protein [Candidatus Lokiarchaeota archaeon]MBD3201600.1 hypothetical protein [Candidatus Lokiarchaeota archaeon]
MTYQFPTKTIYKKRLCYNCGRKINFGEFIVRNSNLSNMRLRKLWESDSLEFYCCLCYDNYQKKKDLEKKIQNLSDLEYDVIKIIENRIHKRLQIQGNLRYDSIGFTINGNAITGLSLFKMSLDEYPKQINLLKSLEYLNLSWNYISYLPKSISHLKNLQSLDLVGNNLVNLPASISSLYSLEVLDLSFNNLEKLPEDVLKMDSLQILKLIRNKIMYLPSSISQIEEKGLRILL